MAKTKKFNHIITEAEIEKYPDFFADYEKVAAGDEIEVTEKELAQIGLGIHVVTEEDTAMLDNGMKVGDEAEYELEPVEKDEVKENEDGAVDPAPVAAATSVKMYNGKVVSSETMRELEGKQYHVVRLEDGSTYDLTDEQYNLEVVIKEA